jgi:hypothetical protein
MYIDFEKYRVIVAVLLKRPTLESLRQQLGTKLGTFNLRSVPGDLGHEIEYECQYMRSRAIQGSQVGDAFTFENRKFFEDDYVSEEDQIARYIKLFWWSWIDQALNAATEDDEDLRTFYEESFRRKYPFPKIEYRLGGHPPPRIYIEWCQQIRGRRKNITPEDRRALSIGKAKYWSPVEDFVRQNFPDGKLLERIYKAFRIYFSNGRVQPELKFLFVSRKHRPNKSSVRMSSGVKGSLKPSSKAKRKKRNR